MSRLPGLGFASTAAAVVLLGVAVVIAAFGLRGVIGPGDSSPSPSPSIAADAPNPSVEPTPEPTLEPSASPSAAPSESPSTEVAYTNPDGIPNTGYAGDDYPFIAQAAELPTYGILWVDPNQRDFHIGVTGDIPGAIEALKDGIPRGITVYFYIVERTQAEVCALSDRIMDDIEELHDHGIFVTGGGCGNKEMTANIYMSPLTPESMAFMRSRYGGPLGFEEGGDGPLRPFDPPFVGDARLQAVREGSTDPLLACGRRPFTSDGLESPSGAEAADGPAADALRVALDVYDEMYADLRALTWQMVEADSYGATFLARRGVGWLEVSVWAGTDGWAPGTMRDCEPQPLATPDGGSASWWLDPEYPAPNASSTELHVLVMESACTGSASPEGRVLPPVVAYEAGTLQLSISIRGLGGMHTCPGNPSFPVTVVLREPLGDRDLAGASSLPLGS